MSTQSPTPQPQGDQAFVSLLVSSSKSNMNENSEIIPIHNPLPIHIARNSVTNAESEQSELMGKSVTSLDEAYDLYNEYSFKYGFGVRKSRNRMKADKSLGLRGKEFCCSKAGLKRSKGKEDREYTKIDTRTDCRAMVYFKLDEETNLWTVSEHIMEHNHPFVPLDERHLIKSHKRLHDREREFLDLLKSLDFNIADGVRLLKGEAEAGGSPSLGFNAKDAYNKLVLDKKKHLKEVDANTLLDMLMKRTNEEKEFFYSFEVDNENGSLVGVFWRDGKMKEQYKLFGDLLILDTTYRTNKYGLICAPFIGMNNHTNNVIFGWGFIFNERIESFQWIFKTFLSSMERIFPKSIMTDQNAPLAAAVRNVFPGVQHRLCTWHIEESSREHIKVLRSRPGFTTLFGHCLRTCESADEFELCWKRLLTEYNCSENQWLQNLYNIRSEWCRAYTNTIFSGGALSSQRNERANDSIRKKLSATDDLVSLYVKFSEIVEEWRSMEASENCTSCNGVMEDIFQNVILLNHAMHVYTIELFELFEKEVKNTLSCQQILLSSQNEEVTYKLWAQGSESFFHVVVFNTLNHDIRCTCNKFHSFGILCCHCLRIYSIYNVHRIPNKYILKRWTKLDASNDCGEATKKTDESLVNNSIWRFQMKRKFDALVNLSGSSCKARAYIEEILETSRAVIDSELNGKEPSPTDVKLENQQSSSTQVQTR